MNGSEAMTVEKDNQHVCPWWVNYFLLCPLRRIFEDPRKILGPHVRQGMTVLEPGCGMGYFSLPLARMVGARGRVVCVDLEPRAVNALRRRARRAGLGERIESIVCADDNLGIEAHRGQIDLVAAIHVVHEVPSRSGFFDQIHVALRAGGRLLLLEPSGHVSEESFAAILDQAREAGFTQCGAPRLRRDHAALLEKAD